MVRVSSIPMKLLVGALVLFSIMLGSCSGSALKRSKRYLSNLDNLRGKHVLIQSLPLEL